MPTRRVDRIFEAARRVLAAELDGGAFRLVGVTAAPLAPGRLADPPDLFDCGGLGESAGAHAPAGTLSGAGGVVGPLNQD